MLSNDQKASIFKPRVGSRTQYVRVPLQVVNNVRELNTNVYFQRLIDNHDLAVKRLCNTSEPVLHITYDNQSVHKWIRQYDRFVSAFRAVNGSRVLRRMQITGFRLCNIIAKQWGYVFYSDTWIRGIDCACVILDMLVRSSVSYTPVKIAVQFNGAGRQQQTVRASIVSHSCWQRRWHASPIDGHGIMYVSAPTTQICEAVNIILNTGYGVVCSVKFIACGISIDYAMYDDDDLRDRYEYMDINVLTSGIRVRRFQRFGQITRCI